MKSRHHQQPQPLPVSNPFALILERLDRIESLLSSAPTNDTFTTKTPPPGMSRRRFNAICRLLHQDGDGRVRKFGRVWTAPREAIEGASPEDDGEVPDAEPWTPENALAAAGIRPQRSVA